MDNKNKFDIQGIKYIGCLLVLLVPSFLEFLAVFDPGLLVVFLVILFAVWFGYAYVVSEAARPHYYRRQQEQKEQIRIAQNAKFQEQAAAEARAERERERDYTELREASASGENVCLKCETLNPPRCDGGHCLNCTRTCARRHCQKCQSCNLCPYCGCGGGESCGCDD